MTKDKEAEMVVSMSDRERVKPQSGNAEPATSPDLVFNSPYLSSHTSSDDLESLEMHDLKRQKHNIDRSRLVGRTLAILAWCRKSRYLVVISSVVSFFLLLVYFWPYKLDNTKQNALPRTSQWIKPEGFKIVGMVFYGRPPTVSILDCYLKRNLISNGGFLDEVLWMANTQTNYDLSYLEKLTNSSELYKMVSLNETGSFGSMWQYATENNTLYIKMDDDVVNEFLNLLTDLADTCHYYRYISMTMRFPDW